MRTKICLILLSCLVFAFDNCKKESKSNQRADTPPPAPMTAAAVAKSLVDSCSLITAQEIEAVQKEKVNATKGSTRTDAGPLAASQCFYTLPTFTKSVSLEVTQSHPAQPDPNVVKEFWKERFQDAKDKKKSDKPKLVAGVGDGAYWVGSNKAGALYVLKNDKIIRISVGGADSEEVKLKNSKTLAENAVKRL